MALVATVNGRMVYSDKQVLAVTNTRITFADGSWCDVHTGQVVNRGSGYINIGSPLEDDGEKVTDGPKSYNALNLEVKDVAAHVQVSVHDQPAVAVTLEGFQNDLKDIRVTQQNDTIVIGEATTPITSDGESNTKVLVTVPKGASVTVSGVDGNTEIGNTEGPLDVSAQAGNISAGRVLNANLHVQGHSDINVDAVNGPVMVHVMGSGDVRINAGTAPSFIASVMGSGDITFQGSADNAQLSVMGSGDIYLAHCKRNPTKRVSGSGDIRVGHVG